MSLRHIVRAALCVALVLIAYGAAGRSLSATPQNLPPPVDRSKLPTLDTSTTGFSIRKLAGPVTIDRAMWFPAPLVNGTVSATQTRIRFVLTLGNPNDTGDVRRWSARFGEFGNAGVTLDNTVSYAHVTIDERFILLEPIDVIDVRRWRRFGLSKAFGIAPYVTLRAFSGDRLRLVFSRRSCPADCPGETDEYFELTLPPAS